MELSERIQISRKLTLFAYAGLLISLLAAQLTTDSFDWWVLLAQVLPLAICFPGVVRGNSRTHVWLGCILLIYSTKFISDIIVTQGSLMSLVQTAFGITLFTAALLFARCKAKQRKTKLNDL